jgi:dTMP kinase
MYIAWEGNDGSGKSSCLNSVHQRLDREGLSIECVGEPGGTEMGLELRKVFKKKRDNEVVSPLSEFLILYSARVQLMNNIVIPALKKGVVFSDRTWISSYAYQQHNDSVFFSLHNTIMAGMPKIDAVIHLNVSPEIGLRRASKRGELDRIEGNELAFFDRANERYKSIIPTLTENHLFIDTNDKSETEVANIAYEFVKSLISKPSLPKKDVSFVDFII